MTLLQTNEFLVEGEEQQQRKSHALIDPQQTRSWLFTCGQISLVSMLPNTLFGGNGRFIQITPVNAEVFVLAHENRQFAALLETTINVVDGRVLQWICKLLYPGRRIVLLKGANFIEDLAAFCRSYDQRLFLLGSSEISNERAVAKLKIRYPGLQVMGYGPPLSESPFDSPCREAILDRIEEFKPHHLGVCFGPVKQEFWIDQNAKALAAYGVRCAYSLGGTIDFLATIRPRAPYWIQYIGAEWLFRFLCEPRARFYRTLIQFKMPVYAAKTRRRITIMNSL